MLSTVLLLRYLAATPGKLPSWSLHIPPRFLASRRTISFPNWPTKACPQGLHSNSFSYLRLSVSNPVIYSFLRVEIPRIEIISHSIHVGLRLNLDVKAQQRGYHHAICPRDTNTATTLIPVLRHRVAMVLEKRSIDSKMTGKSSKNKLPMKEYHALVLGLVAALITGLSCFHTPIFLDLRHDTHEWFQRMCQNLEEGASIRDTVKQNSGGPGGVWNRLCSVFGVLAYF